MMASKKFIVGLTAIATASTVVASASPAAAQDNIFVGNPTAVPNAYFDISGNPFSGPLAGTFGRTGMGIGTFTDNYLFTIGQDGFASFSITSILSGLPGSETDLDFTSVFFNNGSGPMVVPITDLGAQETGGVLNALITQGVQNTITLTYVSRGSGSYGGNLSFSPGMVPTAPVPEPSTWAMMLLGFGFVGGAMRSSKRRQKVNVSYA